MLTERAIRLADRIIQHPKRVIAASLVMTIVAVALGVGVEFRTSRRELASREDPDQRRYERLMEELEGTDPVVVALEAAGEAGGRESLRLAADRIAAALSQHPSVESVFHKVDLDWVLDNGVHLAPPDAIAQISDRFDDLVGKGGRLEIDSGFVWLNETLAGLVEAGLDAGPSGGGDEAAERLAGLAKILDAEREFLSDPETFVERYASDNLLERLAGGDPRVARGGYLGTYDGSILFLLVTPRDDDDGVPAQRRLIAGLREEIDRLAAGESGVRYGITGTAALAVEELDAVKRDSWRTSVVAAIGVTILAALAFRFRSHSVIALVALAAGVAWSLGAVRVELGYLNLITSSFFSTLIGVGIAYAIHPISEYELEGAHTVDPLRAVRRAYHRTGAAVIVSAATTAGAFFAILLMEFRGFQEMGLVAGTGVLLCAIAALVTLPALLVSYGSMRARRARGREAERERRLAAVDRLWVDRLAPWVTRFPKSVLAATAVVTVAAAVAAGGLRFDHDVFDLLPPGNDARRYLEKMIFESDLSPRTNFVVAESVEELREFARRAEAEPDIERFESVLPLLPADREASSRAASDLLTRLDVIDLPGAWPPAARDRIASSLSRLEEVFAEAVDAAFIAGEIEAVEPLESLRASAEELVELASVAPEGAEARWTEAEGALRTDLAASLDRLRRSAGAPPPSIESLPEPVRRRLVSREGRLVGVVYPVGDLFEGETIGRFNAATRRVSGEAAGFPINFEKTSDRITGGFYRAFGVGALLVFLVLFADFRSVRPALLAMLPLAIGVVWTLGGMRALGLSFNLANLVALPLVLGVGIDNGVHIVHRMRLEGDRGMATVVAHTGRAIVIASLTTMVGFGSLAAASHRGMASLGTILLLGIGCCLVTATVVLPSAVVALGIAKK